tara:strand:- start:445 stop:858 length:414 start_codon:yes stop_codon:yes gene_type:complete
MSVILYDKKFITNINQGLISNKEILEMVKKTKHYKYRCDYSFETVEDYIGRMLWYMYVANITAYNLQYRENNNINFDEVEVNEDIDLLKTMQNLGSLLYNVTTNDGNSFIENEWLQTARLIYNKFHPEIIKNEKIIS